MLIFAKRKLKTLKTKRETFMKSVAQQVPIRRTRDLKLSVKIKNSRSLGKLKNQECSQLLLQVTVALTPLLLSVPI